MKPLCLAAFVLVALQSPQEPPPEPPHVPVACARTDGLRDGERVHACTCQRMGVPNGESCDPIGVEPRECKAWCRMDKCTCPIKCDHPESSH